MIEPPCVWWSTTPVRAGSSAAWTSRSRIPTPAKTCAGCSALSGRRDSSRLRGGPRQGTASSFRWSCRPGSAPWPSHVTARAGDVHRWREAAVARAARSHAPGPVAIRRLCATPTGASCDFADMARRRSHPHPRPAGGDGGCPAVLPRAQRPAVPGQLPLRVHRADAQSFPVHRHSQRALRGLSGGGADGREDSPSATRDWRPGTTTDPNRKMALEETPWLQPARGGSDERDD